MFQDSHPFDHRVLWASVRIDPFRPSIFDPQFLSRHRKVRFQLVDSRVLNIAFLNQGFAASEHGNAYDADDIDHSISN